MLKLSVGMEKIVNYIIIGLLGFYALKKKFFDQKKGEYETMSKALEVWREYTEQLTERVNVLTEEIAELRVENISLKREIQNLENILKYREL